MFFKLKSKFCHLVYFAEFLTNEAFQDCCKTLTCLILCHDRVSRGVFARDFSDFGLVILQIAGVFHQVSGLGVIFFHHPAQVMIWTFFFLLLSLSVTGK